MDIAFRYNPDIDDVEIVAGDAVVDTVGSDVFASWVNAYNNKHGFVQRVETEPKGEDKPEAETDSEDKVDESEKE